MDLLRHSEKSSESLLLSFDFIRWLFVGLRVDCGVSFFKLLEERHGFSFKHILLVPDGFFSLKFLLNFGVEYAVYENSIPIHALLIDVEAIAVHHGVFPVSLVSGSIFVSHFSKAAHDPVDPLSGVLVSRFEFVSSETVYLIFLPVAVVLFTNFIGRGKE